MLDSLEFGCAHVASVLRAVQFAEIPDRAIEIVLETDEALVVFVNPLLLLCAISNLLHVAISLCRDDSRVTIRSSAMEDDLCIQIEGEPRGVPIPDAPAGNGSGYCLEGTKRLARAMRGVVSVEHSAGFGSTFTLRLPFRDATA